LALLVVFFPWLLSAGQVARVTQSNFTFTVMAANLTDDPQRYEGPGIRILQGLKPDIVAIQEFNYLNKTPSDMRAFVDVALGTNFSFYREGGGYAIPNGVVSRWPIVESGSWEDPQVPDRGFAWARIDLPGTNDLYLVSVHLHSSGGAGSRAIEAMIIRSNVLARFPERAWVIVAGDLNTGSREETALTTLRGFLSDFPIPTDAVNGGSDKTNKRRTKPYDYVLPSFSLTNHLAPVTVGGQSFPNGLVFDSAGFSPLSALAPIQRDDSTNCQHLAVLKAFQVSYTMTNRVEVPQPNLVVLSNGLLAWNGPEGLDYCVQVRTNLDESSPWIFLATVNSATTNYSHPVPARQGGPYFFRVICP
jgi:endonuclease/exonuclease/phosphatase family metal-dependent hydrolase